MKILKGQIEINELETVLNISLRRLVEPLKYGKQLEE